MQSDFSSREVGADDYEGKIKSAQLELERIQHEREELERKKQQLEESTLRKRVFLNQQVELTEKLTVAVTLIDRELYEQRAEAEHLEQCRRCFAEHLDKIQKYDPEKWTRENLNEKLDKATLVADQAADEYDQAAAYFEGSRSGAIFGGSSKGRRKARAKGGESDFRAQFMSGLAFNLPVIFLGGVGLVIYLIK